MCEKVMPYLEIMLNWMGLPYLGVKNKRMMEISKIYEIGKKILIYIE